MSKRNRTFLSNRANFRLEALETRQLLATIVGGVGGTEVGSNITVSGKVYDQILMTGSSISVQADAGQIVRVDFMDADGDILRAEYSGAGILGITLSGFAGPAAPAKYNIATTKYVSGLATFSIQGENEGSNFLVTSLGPVTAFNGLANPIFAGGTLTGGNNTANVARLQLFGDGRTVTGSNMGSIFAGNAVFSDTAGTVGIIAPNVNFVAGSTITIGDIVPVGSALPTLQIGAFSDMKTVTVAGGTFPAVPTDYTGAGYQPDIFGLNVAAIVSTAGTNSKGTLLTTRAIVSNPAGVDISYNTAGLTTVTIDGSTATTAALDALYKNAFLADVVINNGLAAGVTFHALQFGNITVNGDLAGVITTDVNNDNVASTVEQKIGNVTINGNIVEGGYIEAATSIGDVKVTGTVTHSTTAATVAVGSLTLPLATGVITTLGRVGASAAIGNVSFEGSVNLTAVESLITANRSGAATITGIGTISGVNLTASTGASTLPIIGSQGGTSSPTQGIGGISFVGDVSLTGGGGGVVSSLSIGDVVARSLTLNTNATNGIVANGSGTGGSIGNITTTGGGLTVTAGAITAGSNIGAISVTGGSLTLKSALTAGGNGSGDIGGIAVKNGNLSVEANVLATGGNIGAISVSGNAASAVVGVTAATSIQATVNSTTLLGGTIGNISVTNTGNVGLGSLTLGTGAFSGSILGRNIGNVLVSSGSLVFTNAGSKILGTTTLTDPWLGTSIGDVTVTSGAIQGVTANIEFQANKIGNVSVTGAATTAALLSDVIFSAKGTTQAAALTASIGNITLDISASNTGVISKSAGAAAATTNNTGTGFSSTGNLGNINVKTALGGKILNDITSASLIFRAGNSEMASGANTLASGAAIKTSDSATTINSVSIGTVTISGNLSTGLSAPAKAGVGLVVAAGVDVVGAGIFANIAQNTANAVGLATSTLGSGLPTAAMTSGSIGNVVLSDTSSSTNRSAFVTTQLTETNAGAHTAVSTIIADNISSIIVNTGVQLLNLAPPGAALKGIVSPNATPSTQNFAAGSGDLLIVVL